MFTVKLGQEIGLTKTFNNNNISLMSKPTYKDLEKRVNELEKEKARLKKYGESIKESEKKYKELLNLLPQIVFESDREGNITFANYHAFGMLGYTKKDFDKGVNVLEIIAPHDRDRAGKSIQRVLGGEELGSMEYAIQKKDGSILPVLVYSSPVMHNNKPVGVRGIVIDITEQKRVENLIRSQRDLSIELSTASGLSEGLNLCLETALRVSELDSGGVYLVNKNSGALELAFHKGLPADFIRQASHFEPDSGNVKLVMEGKSIYSQHQKLGVPIDKARQSEQLRAIAVIPIMHQDQVIGCMNVASHTLSEVPGFARDALETIAAQIGSAIVRLQAKEALRKSKERYELATQAGKVGIWDWNIKTNDFYLDPGIKDFLGYTDEEMSNDPETWKEYLHPDDREPVMETAQACIDGKMPEYRFEHRVIHKNGSTCWIQVHGTVIRDKKGKTLRMMGTYTDITERKNAEEALRESEKKYKTLYDTSRDAIMIIEPKRGYLSGNPATVKMFGCKNEAEFITKSPVDLSPEYQPDGTLSIEKAKQVMALVMEKGSHFYEWKHKRISGEEFYATVLLTKMELHGEDVLQATVRDITDQKNAEEERKKLEEQLFQSQKMESIGRLAGGVAHDFNNILTSIMGYAELLKIKFGNISNSEGHAAEIILKSAQRASELIRQLLGFARGGKYNPVPLIVNDVIEEAVHVSENIFEKNIKVTFEFEKKINTVEADKNQLDQVLTNMIINAKDAMPNGGELIFKTENVCLDEEYTGKFQELRPGNYVKVLVTDTGMGMPRSIKDRIFEPFFTTKGAGRGTGLGLATVYGIIKNHNGCITCSSEPGEGTTFTIYLPVSEKEIILETGETKVIKGEETILLVDDEEQVRRVAKDQLEFLGYKVITASDGIEAVNKYKKIKEKIDLILLDMVMPAMSGKETFQALKNIDPDVKIILISGFSQNDRAMEVLNGGALGFIQKPFQLYNLSKIIADGLKK
jgi:PAS domain S-box-containing protein